MPKFRACAGQHLPRTVASAIKPIRVALLGCGTVGEGVVRLQFRHRAEHVIEGIEVAIELEGPIQIFGRVSQLGNDLG